MSPTSTRPYGCLFVLLLTAMFSCAPVALAQQSAPDKQEAVRIAVRQSGGNGKVLSVDLERRDNGSEVFAVKVLNDGRVRVFRIPKSR